MKATDEKHIYYLSENNSERHKWTMDVYTIEYFYEYNWIEWRIVNRI